MVINKSTFISYLKDPNLVGSDSFAGLNEICEAYPYFQSGQLLLTKAYYSSENLNFETSLKKTAAYAANRTQLHSLLFSAPPTDNLEQIAPKGTNQVVNEESVLAEVIKTTPESAAEIQQEVSIKEEEIAPLETAQHEEVLTELADEVHGFVEPKMVQEEISAVSSVENLPEPDPQQYAPIEEPEEEVVVEKTTVLEQDKFSVDFSKIEEGNQQEADELDRQMLSSAISSSILLNVSDEIPDIDSLTPNSQAVGNAEPTEAIDSTTQETSESSENAVYSEEPKLTNSTNSHSFTDWLKTFDEPNEMTDTLEDDEEDVEADYEESPSNVAVVKYNKEKSSFYSPIKMARLSVQEDDDLMTETLANIYADQEHFEKAIKAFEKLQLKYPEKRSYFAGRIKEIQIQLNI